MGTKTTAKQTFAGRGPATHVLCAYPHRQQLKSTQILDDWQRSLDLLEQVPDGDKQLFRIYCNHLIHVERNIAVHEARQTYSDPWTFLVPDGSFDLGDIYLPMGDINLWGDWDCSDWLKEGVDWWRKEIATLVECAGHLSKGTQK